MMSLLPGLAPRDPHSLWYTSTRNPPGQESIYNKNNNNNNNLQNPQQDPSHRRPVPTHLSDLSPLARLRADEIIAERRQFAAQEFGSRWLKPAGVVKTLHQMREERREQDEHQEALRREALAQELAEAEAAGQAGEFLGEDGEGGDGDLVSDGARDLDDEVPDGADMDMGFGSSDDEDEDEDEDGDEEGGGAGGARDELVTVGMRRTGDAFRQALARGHADPAELYGGEDDLDEESRAHMLDEEDLVQADDAPGAAGEDDLDMDADLDGDIPEGGELSGYEHTDSDAEDSSTVDYDDEYDYSDFPDRLAGRSIGHRSPAPLAPPLSPTARVRARGGGPRASLDLSSILSQDGNSFMESSPAMRAPRRQ